MSQELPGLIICFFIALHISAPTWLSTATPGRKKTNKGLHLATCPQCKRALTQVSEGELGRDVNLAKSERTNRGEVSYQTF